MDVNRLELASVRGAIAYVPRTWCCFRKPSPTTSPWKARGDAGGNRDRGAAAAIHDEIVAMKDGYETRIGERAA